MFYCLWCNWGAIQNILSLEHEEIEPRQHMYVFTDWPIGIGMHWFCDLQGKINTRTKSRAQQFLNVSFPLYYQANINSGGRHFHQIVPVAWLELMKALSCKKYDNLMVCHSICNLVLKTEKNEIIWSLHKEGMNKFNILKSTSANGWFLSPLSRMKDQC